LVLSLQNRGAKLLVARVFAAMCEGKAVGRDFIKGRSVVNVQMNPMKVARLLETNFERMNRICEKYNYSEKDIRRMSFDAVKGFGSDEVPFTREE
jgi:hypothetical protein